MKKQAVISDEEFLKKVLIEYSFNLKGKIVEMLEIRPHSKQMLEAWFFMQELNLSEFFNECFNELLAEKRICEITTFYCQLSKTEQQFYGTEKLLIVLKNFENGQK